MPQFTKTGIPTEAEADQEVENYEDDGCTATKKKEGSTWTVVADCPDK